MRVFTDRQNRDWRIELNLGTAKRVRDMTGADILSPEQGDPPLLQRLATDEIFLGEVLFAILSPQFEKANLTDEEIQSSFDGATLLAANDALYLEMIDFFRGRGRSDRAAAVTRQREMIKKGVALLEMKVNSLDLDAMIEMQSQAIDKKAATMLTRGA